VGPKTAGDLGVLCGGKLDAFSNDLAGVTAGLLHDNGRKEWDWTRHECQGSGDLKTVIEQAADANPQAERWTYQSFTIRQNQSL